MKTREELLSYINNVPELSALEDIVKQHCTKDAAHSLAHFHRVALWTIKIDPRLNPRHAIAAALLHDIINIPKNSPERPKASEYSASFAQDLLPKFGFNSSEVLLIIDAIRDHSYSRGTIPKSPLGKALQDADRLESLGAIGIMRVFSTGARMDAAYFNDSDPWAKNRLRDDIKFSIDHFFEKLFKLPSTMNTEEGKKEAYRRCEIMHLFLEQLGIELGEFLPSSISKD